MNQIRTARMLITTAALVAVAALVSGGANAAPPTIPYLSHGSGVDESLFAGQGTQRLTGVHAALERDLTTASSPTVQPTAIPYLSHGIGVDESRWASSPTVQPTAIPYLSHGIGVDESRFGAQPSLGLGGDSALTRVSAPEPEGLTGDSALTRYPGTVTLPTSPGGRDLDWTSFGAGAGLAALVAAAIAGIWLVTRRRGGVALP